jgi:hypothetical protein
MPDYSLFGDEHVREYETTGKCVSFVSVVGREGG